MVDIIIPMIFYSDYAKKMFLTVHRTEIPHRIIILDNGITTKDKEAVKGEADIYVENPRNLGVSRSWNLGATYREGVGGIFLNDDILLPNNWLESFIEAWGMGNKLIGCDWSHGPNDRQWRARYSQAKGPNPLRDASIYNFNGACFGMPWGWYEKLGPFNEFYLYFFSDTDYFKRSEAAGYHPMLMGGTINHHFQNSTVKKLPDVMRTVKKERQHYEEEWGAWRT